MLKNNTKAHRRRKSRIILLVSLVLAVGIVASLVFYARHQQTHSNGSLQTTQNTVDQKPQPVTNKGSSSQNNPTPAPTVDVNQPLTKPTGSFVSNHTPGQNRSPLTESSICITTPGAKCYISFTNGTVTKALSAVTVDNSGTAYWPEWSPASIGLTKGSWSVSAVATLGSQTATTQDQIPLEITQ